MELERVAVAVAAAGVAAAAACFDVPLKAVLRLRLTDMVLVERCIAPLPAPDGLASEPRLEVGGGVGVSALELAALLAACLSSSSFIMSLHNVWLTGKPPSELGVGLLPVVPLTAPPVVATSVVVGTCFACFFDCPATIDRLGEVSCCCDASRPRLCDPPLAGARAGAAAVQLGEPGAAAVAATLAFLRELGLDGAAAVAEAAVVALDPLDAA